MACFCNAYSSNASHYHSLFNIQTSYDLPHACGAAFSAPHATAGLRFFPLSGTGARLGRPTRRPAPAPAVFTLFPIPPSGIPELTAGVPPVTPPLAAPPPVTPPVAAPPSPAPAAAPPAAAGPLSPSSSRCAAPRSAASASARLRSAACQGLTRAHFSAQPEPFPTLKTSPKRLNTPSIHAINTP
jgi:hypothetical protein